MTAASRSKPMVSSSSERAPSIIWIPMLAGSTFVVILTFLDRTELADERVLALVRGGTLEVPPRVMVLVLRLFVGFALLGMEAAQSLMPAEKYFFPLEVESLRK
jgi:hypothetical protein